VKKYLPESLWSMMLLIIYDAALNHLTLAYKIIIILISLYCNKTGQLYLHCESLLNAKSDHPLKYFVLFTYLKLSLLDDNSWQIYDINASLNKGGSPFKLAQTEL